MLATYSRLPHLRGSSVNIRSITIPKILPLERMQTIRGAQTGSPGERHDYNETSRNIRILLQQRHTILGRTTLPRRHIRTKLQRGSKGRANHTTRRTTKRQDFWRMVPDQVRSQGKRAAHGRIGILAGCRPFVPSIVA